MQKYFGFEEDSRFRKIKKKVQTDHGLGILKIVTHETGPFCKKRQFARLLEWQWSQKAQIRIVFKA